MTDNLLSVFDPTNVELPEEQPDQNQAQEILEAKLNKILEQDGEALLQAIDFIGYQVDRIRRSQANAGICKQTIAQAQANKRSWERETEFRRWAIQQSLDYLKTKGLLDKPQLTGPDYKVSISQRQGGLEVSEDLQDFLEELQSNFTSRIDILINQILADAVSERYLESIDLAKTAHRLGLTTALHSCLKVNVSISIDKAEVKRKLKQLGPEAKHFSIEKSPSLTAKI